MREVVKVARVAALALLGFVPAIVASGAVRHFIAVHPAWAVYVPVIVAVAAAVDRWVEKKAANKNPAKPASAPKKA